MTKIEEGNLRHDQAVGAYQTLVVPCQRKFACLVDQTLSFEVAAY